MMTASIRDRVTPDSETLKAAYDLLRGIARRPAADDPNTDDNDQERASEAA